MRRDREIGCWVPTSIERPPTAGGVLAGKTVALKDLFDIAGHRTPFGVPRWRETHPVSRRRVRDGPAGAR